MPRPFTSAQAHENDAFLRALRRTGNAHEAARAMGIYRAKMTKRRAKDAAFAAGWGAALTLAHAELNRPAAADLTGTRTARTPRPSCACSAAPTVVSSCGWRSRAH